jgi:hypothetical protein
VYPRQRRLIPQSGTKGPFVLLFRNADISRKAGPRFWIQQRWYRYNVTYFVFCSCRQRSRVPPLWGSGSLYRHFPTVPLRSTVGYRVVAPPGLGLSSRKQRSKTLNIKPCSSTIVPTFLSKFGASFRIRVKEIGTISLFRPCTAQNFQGCLQGQYAGKLLIVGEMALPGMVQE